jgi:hypothetical protein
MRNENVMSCSSSTRNILVFLLSHEGLSSFMMIVGLYSSATSVSQQHKAQIDNKSNSVENHWTLDALN